MTTLNLDRKLEFSMVESPTNFKKQDKVQLIYIVMLAIVRTVYNGLEELVLGVR